MTKLIIFPRRHYQHRRRERVIGAVAVALRLLGWAFVAYVIVDSSEHLVEVAHTPFGPH